LPGSASGRPEETEVKLLEVSERARERVRGGNAGYFHVTVKKAGEWLAGAPTAVEPGLT